MFSCFEQFNHFRTLKSFLLSRFYCNRMKIMEEIGNDVEESFFFFFFKKYFTVLCLTEYEFPAAHVANVSVSWWTFLPLWKCQRSGFVHGDENAEKQDE